jgi:predicted nucleotidyltransferase
MTREEILAEIERRLREAFGPRYRGAVLYGSEARGESRPDSDIDVLVLLEGPVKQGQDLVTIIESLYNLQLEMIDSKGFGDSRVIHAVPADERVFEEQQYFLYQEVKAVGVPI